MSQTCQTVEVSKDTSAQLLKYLLKMTKNLKFFKIYMFTRFLKHSQNSPPQPAKGPEISDIPSTWEKISFQDDKENERKLYLVENIR